MRDIRWHHWYLNVGERSLDHRENVGQEPSDYEVDLDWALDSAQILDWIFQIHNKTWCDDYCLRGLVCAFDDLIGQSVCSFGVDRSLTTAEMSKRIERVARSYTRHLGAG